MDSKLENEPPRRIRRSVVEPGRNCWRVGRADRVAVLIDVADYFEAFAAAAERARRSIMIVGWDFNGNVRLRRGGSNRSAARDETLGDFLDRLVKKNRKLHVHILAWDFSMIYAPEREILPLYRNDWRTHRRVHFELDGTHPIGASHHQKIVVIDDRVAFVGGMDFARRRWDTSAHAEDDERRTDPNGASYAPFHDVQMMVEGAVARDVGDLVRLRWRYGTGKRIAARDVASDPWPDFVEPDFRDVDVAIARTEPTYGDRPEVREIEQSYLDCIEGAERSVYIENQYFTAAAVGDAVEARLQSPRPVEVALVSRRSCSGWLEQQVMGTLRADLLRRLTDAQNGNRFRAYSPTAAGEAMDLHSKVMVVDDRLLRVGSANLANRSMGLDTECDLILEATNDDERSRIAAVRARLLADHLGTDEQSVARAIAESGSLCDAIERMRGGPKTLDPLTADAADESWLQPHTELYRVADPEKPVEAELFDHMFSHARAPQHEAPGRLGFALILGLFLAVAAAWRWTPLGDYLQADRLAQWLDPWSQSAAGIVLAVALFAAASTAMVPVVVLIGAYSLVFEPATALAVTLCGALASAALTFSLGRRVPRRIVRKIAGERLNTVSSRLRGAAAVLPLAALRLIPVAPFTVFNLVAGAMHIPRSTFLIATALGLIPGTLALVLVGSGVRNGVPVLESATTILGLVGLLLLAAGGFYARSRNSGEGEEQAGARS